MKDIIDKIKAIHDKVDALPEPDKSPPLEMLIQYCQEIIDMELLPKLEESNRHYHKHISYSLEPFVGLKELLLLVTAPVKHPMLKYHSDTWHGVIFKIHKKEMRHFLIGLSHSVALKEKLLEMSK